MNTTQSHSCSRCAMSQICLPLGVVQDDLKKLEAMVETSNTLARKDTIFRQGDHFDKVYAIKSGSLKSTRVDENGNEFIIGFHLPGELVGLDGIYAEHYACTTETLDSTVLCEMDYDKLTELCSDIPTLQRQLLRLLSREICESHAQNADNADLSAMQKLAGFVSNLSARYELRGYNGRAFRLSMSRQDIAKHLGLSPETVSRLLKRLKDDGIISVCRRQLQILDIAALQDHVDCVNA